MSYTREQLERIGFGSLGSGIQIDESVKIFNPAKVFLSSRIRIDCFCVISAGDEGIYIGNNVHISASAQIFGSGGRVTMEDFSGLSGRAAIYTASDDFSGEAMTNPTVPDRFRKVTTGPVTLRRHVLVGSGAIILPNVTVGFGAAVGALSLVRSDVNDHEIVAGIPACQIGTRKKDLFELEKEYQRGR